MEALMIVRSQTAQANPIIEMNTTPLIDVMLVLLVMFIITIPIQTHAIKLDLPGPGPAPKINPAVNLLEITREGGLLWNGQPITRDDLRYDLDRSQQLRPVPELHFRPDAQSRYEAVSDVLGIIKREQVKKFGFVGNEAYSNW
jgi:biopolymer transport protein ExbD